MKEHLNNCKQEYESIPIPEELEFRVRSSMEEAKRRSRRDCARKTWRRSATTAAAVLVLMVALVNSNAGIASAMEKVPVLGAITRVFTFRTYEDERPNSSADIRIPQVVGGPDELTQAIADYTDTIIARYEEESGIVNASDVEARTNHYQVGVDYSVVTDSDSLFALRFDEALVMASGTESVVIYNVDKASGKIISLADLFESSSDYKSLISENIKEQMHQRMEEDDSVYYWLNDEVSDWNFTTITDETTFYVDENQELIIVFNEGDVAPMYMGVVEFVIPASVTEGIARRGYLN
ncbi:RsiV family protein [Oscillibacter sp. MSJ-2]|uniref:RsiV family protein n=1 Tax=Dysosmobacter acutus TaxID=2841504 RepID=A0ABS6F7A4_9FIRM|nr:RsiV family protein [Dysosmobacter acutus]MBU5626164.1 RsiV family protein [Dysosmobacter acutus]